MSIYKNGEKVLSSNITISEQDIKDKLGLGTEEKICKTKIQDAPLTIVDAIQLPYINAGEVCYIIKDGFCTVSMEISISEISTTTNLTIPVSGLPKPILEKWYIGISPMDSKSCLVLPASDTLVVHISSLSSGSMYCTFVYQIAES